VDIGFTLWVWFFYFFVHFFTSYLILFWFTASFPILCGFLFGSSLVVSLSAVSALSGALSGFGDKALFFCFFVVVVVGFAFVMSRPSGRMVGRFALPFSGGWGVAVCVGFAYSSCAHAFGWERVVLHVIRIHIRSRWWWSVVVCQGL